VAGWRAAAGRRRLQVSRSSVFALSVAESPLAHALRDRYLLERELGHGGMATVYLAHDLRHDRRVALKVLRPELAAVLGAERFLNEVRVDLLMDAELSAAPRPVPSPLGGSVRTLAGSPAPSAAPKRLRGCGRRSGRHLP
jgi:serine/threonine protein kinase